MKEKKKEIIYLFIGYTGAFVCTYAVNILNNYIVTNMPLIWRAFCLIADYWLIALVPFLLMVRQKERPGDIGFTRKNMPAQIVTGILIALIMSGLLTLVPYLAGFGQLVDPGYRYTHLWQIIYEFVYAIVSVSAAEEFVCRGYLYMKIKNIFGNEWPAIIISSIMFGLLHVFQGNPVQVFMTMLLGLFWCILRQKIKDCSLLSLILAHGIYDALIVVWVSVLAG